MWGKILQFEGQEYYNIQNVNAILNQAEISTVVYIIVRQNKHSFVCV